MGRINSEEFITQFKFTVLPKSKSLVRRRVPSSEKENCSSSNVAPEDVQLNTLFSSASVDKVGKSRSRGKSFLQYFLILFLKVQLLSSLTLWSNYHNITAIK